MGGGGSSGSVGQDYATPDAAMGAAYSNQGGYGSGFNWGTLGKGIQGAGSAVSAGGSSSPNYMTGVPGSFYAPPPQYQPAPPFQMISQSSGNNDFAMMLQRLLGGY